MIGRSGRLVLLLTAASVSQIATAQDGITYDAARVAAMSRDPDAQSSDLALLAAENTAAALDNLNRPTVTAAASVIGYRKTLSVDLTGTKQAVSADTARFLDGLPGGFPPEFSAIVNTVAGRIQDALPGLLAPIPDELRYRAEDVIVRPTISAVMPIYTGGALEAVKDGALAGVTLARGRQWTTLAGKEVSLAQRYFGLQLARELSRSAEQRLAANERHLSSTRAMEREGILPHSATLEVTVLRDAARRYRDRARREETVARLSLARMTGREVDGLATPLFVNSAPLPPLAVFREAAAANGTGQAILARGQTQLAHAGEKLARASRRPRAYAFGAYSVDPSTNLPTEPEWVAGATVSYTLFSPVDRDRLVTAANARSAAAAADERAAADRIEGEIERTYAMAESARSSFLSMEASLAAARENLRVQEIAFREGVGTIDRLLAAQAALGTAQGERAAAAYEYDVSLAALLAVSGNPGMLGDYARRDDRKTVDGE